MSGRSDHHISPPISGIMGGSWGRICAVMGAYSPVTRWASTSQVPFSFTRRMTENPSAKADPVKALSGATLRSVRFRTGVCCGEEFDPFAGVEIDGPYVV